MKSQNRIMKLFKKLYLLLIFLSIQLANSQLKESFEKGFIITKTGEKISGYIRKDDFKNKVNKICFKKILENKKCKLYDTIQITSFKSGDDELYDLFEVEINNKSKKITLFAKKLLGGEISLYKGFYNGDTFYIVSKREENYILQKDKLVSGETKVTRYNYLGILNSATENFPIRTGATVEFNQRSFIDIIGNYNKSKGANYEVIKTNDERQNFWIITGGLGFGNEESEFFFQFNNRLFFPKFSRNTSFSTGLNYYNYQYTDTQLDTEVTQSLISIPFQIQHNFLNKNIRPYIVTGASLSFLSRNDEDGNSIIEETGFQSDFGLGFILGAGIELDLYKGLILKSEYRHETFTHLLLFGIGYHFMK